MIVSYRDKRTREFAERKFIRAFSGFSRQTEMKLDQLEAAASWKDLAVLPGNRFEALKGDRKGRYGIRVNDQWRICFEWPDRRGTCMLRGIVFPRVCGVRRESCRTPEM